ncbi:hypothetical protein QFE98_04355 [Streptococcus uberis]|uniref:hypothetical protein n=1 Tax=Streptococcus uberis TaxID=1349 RepID=UPI0038928868
MSKQEELTLEEFKKIREDFMDDKTSVSYDEIPKLLEIAEKLKNEDDSLNVFELYKFPQARKKLFDHITEACYLTLKKTPTQIEKGKFQNYLEEQFQKILRKLVNSTDFNVLYHLKNELGVPDEHLPQFIRDFTVSGLLRKDVLKKYE